MFTINFAFFQTIKSLAIDATSRRLGSKPSAAANNEIHYSFRVLWLPSVQVEWSYYDCAHRGCACASRTDRASQNVPLINNKRAILPCGYLCTISLTLGSASICGFLTNHDESSCEATFWKRSTEGSGCHQPRARSASFWLAGLSNRHSVKVDCCVLLSVVRR